MTSFTLEYLLSVLETFLIWIGIENCEGSSDEVIYEILFRSSCEYLNQIIDCGAKMWRIWRLWKLRNVRLRSLYSGTFFEEILRHFKFSYLNSQILTQLLENFGHFSLLRVKVTLKKSRTFPEETTTWLHLYYMTQFTFNIFNFKEHKAHVKKFNLRNNNHLHL